MNLAALDRPRAPFGTRTVEVAERSAAGAYESLTLVDTTGPRPRAGQFYMLRSAGRWGGGEDGRPFLSRALSFARVLEVSGGVSLEFFFEVVGPGTERLAELSTGDAAVIAGPFGNGFALDDTRDAVLVAGGIGLAPIVALADEFGDGPRAAKVIAGMRTAEHAAAIDHFGLVCGLATDDGSVGKHGYVTELLEDELATGGDAVVHACGPAPMLEAVRAICTERSVLAQLAMEAPMACGFGACHGCVVETNAGYLRLCVDGPVVDASKLTSALAPEGG